MKILIADRKNKPTANTSSNTTRTPFTTVLNQATVIFLSLPRMDDTLNTLSTTEFSAMSPSTVLINVSRGGIVDESALVEALEQGQLSGAACDVFREEPAWSGNSPLVRALQNAQARGQSLPLTVTPHTAWYSGKTGDGLQRMTQEIVAGWVRGDLRDDYVVQ